MKIKIAPNAEGWLVTRGEEPPIQLYSLSQLEFIKSLAQDGLTIQETN